MTDSTDDVDWYDGPDDERPISRRDRFAMAALTGLLTNPQQLQFDVENQVGLVAEYADALIAELDKEQSRE